jgi:hypothetical protein
MAKSFKKVIACALAVLMVAVSVPFTALAAVGDYAPDIRLQFYTYSNIENADTFYDASTVSGKACDSSYDESGIFSAPLTYDWKAGTLKYETSKAAAALELAADEDYAVGIGEDHTYGVGDVFAVTATLDNVDFVHTMLFKVAYSSNIEPAAVYTNGLTNKNEVAGVYTASEAAADEDLEPAADEAGKALAVMSSRSFYSGINDCVMYDNSYTKDGIMSVDIELQDGSTTRDISSTTKKNTTFIDPNTGKALTDYNDAGEGAIMETFVFKIVGTGKITFDVYDTDATKPTKYNNACYVADFLEGTTTDKITTYAINPTSDGSAKMTFMGKNVNVASTGYTITYTTNDSDLGSVTIDDVETKNGASYGDYDPNSVAKLVATPDTEGGFVGWYVDGKLVSTDLEYDLTVVSNTNVKAVFNSSKNDDITVVFLDKYNNVLKTYTGAASEVADNAPVVSAVGVYTFKAWDTDLTAITSSTTVKATYTKNTDTTYTVETAEGVEINGDSTSATATFAYDTKVTLYKEGASYWYIGDEADPTIVAYGDTYDFYVGGDITVKPSTETVVAANASAAIVSTILNTETGKARFLATTTLTTDDSVVLIEHGFIYGRDMADTDLTLEKVDTKVGSYTVKKSVANPDSSEFALNYKCNPASGSTATGKAVAYVVYSVNGVVQDTVYSNVGSYEFK